MHNNLMQIKRFHNNNPGRREAATIGANVPQE